MYFPYFIAYISIGLIISLVVFLWAVQSGQFKDQQRARFLPLRDEPNAGPVKVSDPIKVSRCSHWEAYGLFVLALAGLAMSATVLLYALYFSK